MKVNGKDYIYKNLMTVEHLLKELNHRSDRVAVEVNGKIVKRANFSEITLQKDDLIEIVAFVGGG